MSGWFPVSEAPFNVGDRVELVHCTDEYTRLEPGAKGTVRLVDDNMGTIHVEWDDGHRLGIVPEAGDRISLVLKGDVRCAACGDFIHPQCDSPSVPVETPLSERTWYDSAGDPQCWGNDNGPHVLPKGG